MAGKTGVYPVYENQFKIDKAGGDGSTADNLVGIADMESFSVSIDGNVEEWKPFEAEGWTRRLMTGKSITISISGKRNVGDAGQRLHRGAGYENGRGSHHHPHMDFPERR